jgi:regulator of protease activity HflC (stomatin/prohibitin superfamily)
MTHDKPRNALPGGPLLVLHLAMLGGAIWLVANAKALGQPNLVVAGGGLFVLTVLGLAGFFVVNPNEAVVLQLFGSYVGTVRTTGLKWALPFYSKKRASLRAISFQSEHLKVNDADGNPIEIAAIVVWRVVDSARSLFDVDNAGRYVQVQAEAALRNMATSYPYDAHDENQLSLRGSTGQIAEHLKKEVQDKVDRAGVEILDARISHLAYAPEIAQAMLQRQQAAAIIAARQKIVEGAVGMVEMALARLSKHQIVVLDEERKAQMVSNLLVVLCGERSAQPVVNAGTLYS